MVVQVGEVAARKDTRCPKAPRYGSRSLTGWPFLLTLKVSSDSLPATGVPASVTSYPPVLVILDASGNGIGMYNPETFTSLPSVRDLS